MSLRKNLIKFLCGADLEFLCLWNGQLVGNNHEEDNHKSPWGLDGGGAMLIHEIRPAPSEQPEEIVKNIHKIFQWKISREPSFLKYNWVAGSYVKDRCLGGHLHVGIPKTIIHPKIVAQHFDHYVGAISILLEDIEQGKKRRNYAEGEDINGNQGYGNATDYREQPHGAEYRTPGSFLSSPYITLGFLSLTKVVAYELINNSTFGWNEYIEFDDFKYMRKDKVRNKLPQIWSDITKMHLYNQYRKSLDFLKFLVDNKCIWFPKSGLKESWGIKDLKYVHKEQDMTLQDIWN